jgi:hypothetical protein
MPVGLSLQNANDLRYHKRAWLIQRIGWAAMAALVIAGGLGVFGNGILSSASIRPESNGPRLEYQRFIRNETPSVLNFYLKPAPDGTLRVWVSRDYLKTMELQGADPPPKHSEVAADRVRFEFQGSTDGKAALVSLYYKPRSVGAVQGAAGAGDTEFQFFQFVYP